MSNSTHRNHEAVSQRAPLPAPATHPEANASLESLKFGIASIMTIVLPVVAAALVASSAPIWSAVVAIAIILTLGAMAAWAFAGEAPGAPGATDRPHGESRVHAPHLQSA